MTSLKPVLASLLIGIAAAPFVGLADAEAQTASQPGYSRTTQCFRDEYREDTYLAQKIGLDTFAIGPKR